MGIAAEVVRIACEEAQKHGARAVTGLTLRVGRWSGVEPESLRFAVGALCEGTAAARCRIVIEPVEPAFACSTCGVPYAADDRFSPCPRCGGPGGDLVAGDEMTLSEIDVEEA
jgi:hydrogenase nickel incorporation protein HypA/HybF